MRSGRDVDLAAVLGQRPGRLWLARRYGHGGRPLGTELGRTRGVRSERREAVASPTAVAPVGVIRRGPVPGGPAGRAHTVSGGLDVGVRREG